LKIIFVHVSYYAIVIIIIIMFMPGNNSQLIKCKMNLSKFGFQKTFSEFEDYTSYI